MLSISYPSTMVFRCCDKKHIANRRAFIWSGLRPSVCSPANNQGSVERQKKPTRQVACEITKDGVVTVKSTQLGEWDLEAIQAHADFLSLKDTELNLKELKASRHTPRPTTEPFVCCRTDSSSHLVARLRRMVLDRVTLSQVFTMFKHRLESCQ